MKRIQSFAFARYGEDGAMMLAREAQARYQYFYDVFMDSDKVAHHFSTAEVEGYCESRAFADWVESLEPDSKCRVRAGGVRALRPRIGT